jgi:hypothetical protein
VLLRKVEFVACSLHVSPIKQPQTNYTGLYVLLILLRVGELFSSRPTRSYGVQRYFTPGNSTERNIHKSTMHKCRRREHNVAHISCSSQCCSGAAWAINFLACGAAGDASEVDNYAVWEQQLHLERRQLQLQGLKQMVALAGEQYLTNVYANIRLLMLWPGRWKTALASTFTASILTVLCICSSSSAFR